MAVETLKKLRKENMMLNVGPSHPAMHGIVRMMVELDGETVVNSDVEIGFLHRCFEKDSEQFGYLQVIPYTDRLNYVSPLINNVGYCMAVEKLFDLKVPERAQYIRVIMSELSRVTDHLTCIAANSMELGAFTVFLYMIKQREEIYQLIEEVTGARLTISYARVGGVKGDLPDGFEAKCHEVMKRTREVIRECDQLLTHNRIFVDRVKNIGVISKEDAISHSMTGPFLRSTGIDFDVRRATPYLVYDRFDFEVPVGSTGDCLDRYLVRMAEMEQSFRIVEQAYKQMPTGHVLVNEQGEVVSEVVRGEDMVDRAKMGNTEGIVTESATFDPTLAGDHRQNRAEVGSCNKRAAMPPKEETYSNIEGLMNHFKTVMVGHGTRPPAGEAYQAVEGANGELGFYVVSDGTGTPYRVRVRPPCFTIMSGLHKIVKGDTLADIVASFGSVNMIGGEMDR